MKQIGFTLTTLGEILIAITVLSVHGRVAKEHKIDSKVFLEIKKEKTIGVVGILLLILGFILQLPFL